MGRSHELPREADDLRIVCSHPSPMNHQPSTLSSPTCGNRKLPMGNFLPIADRFAAIDPRLAGVTPASRLSVRSAPEMVFSGIAAIDVYTVGLPLGCLTEICVHASACRTALLLAALSAGTRRGEFCALVDASDALDPQSAAAAGVQFERLLWIRCGESWPQKHFSTRQKADAKRNEGRNAENRLEQVLRVTDLLLESGGFGVVALDLADLPPPAARRIPLATWFRFRRAVEPTSTMLLTLEQQPIAGSCSSLVMKLQADSGCYLSKSPLVFSRGRIAITEISHVPSHAQLLEQIEIKAELIRSRPEGKPVGSVAFASRTAWADVKAA